MSVAVVRCPSCEQPSRVPITAQGLVVACPRCRHEFTAVALTPTPTPPAPRPVQPLAASRRDEIPVVHPTRRTAPHPASRPAVAHDDVPTIHPHQTLGGPVALALLPLGVPLLWLVLSLAVGRSEFSFVAAVAIAVGMVGLGLGLACIRRWSAGLRMRLLVAHLVLTYVAAALFYFAPPDWLERVREVAAVSGLVWREFRPEDRTFQLLVPGEPQESVGPVPEWKLTARQFVDEKNAVDLYVVAYGDPPPGLGAKAKDEVWFAAARDAIAAACEGTLADERVVSVPTAQGREYQFDLPAGKRRVVRVVRTESKVYYLGVEGPYLSAERQDVQRYLGSFRLTPGQKKK